jgi:hypothetical protein
MKPIEAWTRWAVVTPNGGLYYVGRKDETKADVDLQFAGYGDRTVRVEIRELPRKAKR